MNKKEQIQLLAQRIDELYQAMKLSADCRDRNHFVNLHRYHDLVDELVELTNGEAKAFYTENDVELILGEAADKGLL